MMTCLSQTRLAITFAPRGIGKEPIRTSTLTVSAGLADTGLVCEAAAAGEDAAWLMAGEAWLVAGERDAGGLALVIPALHAARDRPAAQVVTAMRRYAFIGYLSVNLIASSRLESRRAAGMRRCRDLADGAAIPAARRLVSLELAAIRFTERI